MIDKPELICYTIAEASQRRRSAAAASADLETQKGAEIMFEWIKKKARQVREWAEEHPILAATVVVVSVAVTGGIAYLVIRNMNGDEELIAMPQDLIPQLGDGAVELNDIDIKELTDLEETEPVVEPPQAESLEDDEDYAYWVSSRCGHPRNIAPRIPSEAAKAEAARNGVELPENYTWVRPSNPRIRCAVDDPRAILPLDLSESEEASSPFDMWDEDEIVVELIGNMETMDTDVFEKLYGRLDVDHQIEVDESIREFANNAVGCDYWDSDE